SHDARPQGRKRHRKPTGRWLAGRRWMSSGGCARADQCQQPAQRISPGLPGRGGRGIEDESQKQAEWRSWPGIMAVIYYDQDANLDVLKGLTIAIIGYGSQGHAHALNLRDSGLKVIVANRPGSENYRQAVADGWQPVSAAEAAAQADIIVMLAPDQVQPQIYENDIRPHLTEGKALVFSHGFNIHFRQIVPPPNVDVFMVAPKSPGHLVRRMFE